MNIRIGRLAIAAIGIEILAIVLLVVVVAMFGPSDPGAAQVYAESIGTWFGPVMGFILCLVGGWLITRKLESDHVVNGLVLGVLVAVIDIVLLIIGGPEFSPVFILSNVGRVVAGALGGLISARSSTE